MESELISVIVPVYNVKAYLPRCLESIAAQGYEPMEVILVDDGSTDGSGTVCDEWAERDSRFKVLHRDNAGPGQARNAGLDVSHGHYVAFIDSDDYVHPDYLSTLHRLAEECDAEAVLCRWTEFRAGQDEPKADAGNGLVRVMSGKEALRRIFYQDDLTHSPWGRLLKRSLFDDCRFTEKYVYEDLEIAYALYRKAAHVVETDANLYCYLLRDTSLMRTFNPRRTVVLDITERLEHEVGETDPDLLPAVRSRRLSANFNMLRLMPRHEAEYAPLFDRCWATVKQLRGGCLSDRSVRLKNKVGILLSYLGKRLTILVLNGRKV